MERADSMQLVIRLKPEMHEALRAWAKAEDRTVSQQVRFVLREAMRAEGRYE